MTGAAVKKVYSDKEGMVMLICPHCGEMKKEGVESYIGRKGPFTMECGCGKTYDVDIELRKSYRKKIRLDGVYMLDSDPKGAIGKIFVTNVSMGGCGFEPMAINHGMQPGDVIQIQFRLNNQNHTLMKKKAVVRMVDKRYVGCEFLQPPGTVDPDLGFFMRNP